MYLWGVAGDYSRLGDEALQIESAARMENEICAIHWQAPKGEIVARRQLQSRCVEKQKRPLWAATGIRGGNVGVCSVTQIENEMQNAIKWPKSAKEKFI